MRKKVLEYTLKVQAEPGVDMHGVCTELMGDGVVNAYVTAFVTKFVDVADAQ